MRNKTAVNTHQLDSLDKRQIVCDNFAELWEVPAIPFTSPHHIVIEFLINVIE